MARATMARMRPMGLGRVDRKDESVTMTTASVAAA
jgi:hypothetical protein